MIRLLALHRIHFMVVGGMAAIAHGSARFTLDLDPHPASISSAPSDRVKRTTPG
jgi:hypothetical protein